MPLFRPAGTNYIPVLDIASAASWYADAFGLRQHTTKFDDGQKGIELSDSDNEVFFVLGPRDVPANHETAMLYTSHIDQARKHLTSRGVIIDKIQRDRQGTRFFEIRDLEGNTIEICDEP
jgi:predicted enzyme related to lactoylglutathione lyase